jgi:predicted DsbA family dithiol-disulfide isomerase
LQRIDSGVEVIWRSYELRPDPVPTLDPKGEYLQRVWGSSVYPLAKSLNIPIKLPPLQPRSRQAHEAAHWARKQGKFNEYNDAIFRAFFVRGEDIGDPEVLTRLASEVALDAKALTSALDEKEYLDRVVADQEEARKLGITGVPALVANRRIALSGVQSVENLQKLVDRARAS